LRLPAALHLLRIHPAHPVEKPCSRAPGLDRSCLANMSIRPRKLAKAGPSRQPDVFSVNGRQANLDAKPANVLVNRGFGGTAFIRGMLLQACVFVGFTPALTQLSGSCESLTEAGAETVISRMVTCLRQS